MTNFNIVKTRKDLPYWNHRWEYEKNRRVLFEALFRLKEIGLAFDLIVLGEQNNVYPPIFEKAKHILANQIIHWGYATTFEQYARLLWKADILPVTSNQDFFGVSVVEAMYCGCVPLLPNRLAYPEHLTEEQKNKCLYEEGELTTRLATMIKEFENIKSSSIVIKYDWGKLIALYNDRMQLLATQ